MMLIRTRTLFSWIIEDRVLRPILGHALRLDRRLGAGTDDRS
jgi:hypothetical protein